MKKNVNNLETLDIKAKKKKNFIVIAILLGVVTILFISIGSAFLNVDKKKIYEERKKIESAKELKVIQNPEFKENWAISIENRMEQQEKKTQEVIATLSGKQDRVLDELKSIIEESSFKNTEELKNLSESFDLKLGSLKEEFQEQVEAQNARLEQVAIIAEESNKSGRNTGDVMIGSDLLPDREENGGNGNGEVTIIVGDGLTADNKDVDLNESKKTAPLSKEEMQKKLEEELANAANKAIDSAESEDKVEEIKEKPKEIVSLRKNIKFVDIDTSFNTKILAAQNTIDQNAIAAIEDEEVPMSYHISTGLTQAYMITGAYAPAFQEGDSEPLPVLLEAEGEILQPNDNLASVDKCFLLGSAKGNMNSQTANIKLVSISCLLAGGEYRIEGAISGWVIGENGIPGVHGELLHKNGAWLARTFVSGFLETFANAIGGGTSTAINLGSSDDGADTTDRGTAINDNLATAGADGISTVFNKLGDYYLKMAEQIFPVIEVRGGRTIDILLIGGEDLSVVENNKMNLDTINDNLSKLKLKNDLEKGTMTQTNAFTKSIMESEGSENSVEEEIPSPEIN